MSETQRSIQIGSTLFIHNLCSLLEMMNSDEETSSLLKYRDKGLPLSSFLL